MSASQLKISTFLAVGVIIGLVCGLQISESGQSDSESDWPLPRAKYNHAAVSADGLPCPSIGTAVLLDGGTVVDSAIATLFCLGVVNAQSMGIGGGFFLTYYNRTAQTAHFLDARETAPAAATKDMFEGNGTLSAIGGLAVGVPGEMRGYWEAYQQFGGGVSWERLIEPTIQICEDGNPVNRHMANALSRMSGVILASPSMSVFVNRTTGEVFQEGDILKRPILAQTLRVLQKEPDAVHTGSLAAEFLQDLEDLGSIITKEDMENYKPIWRDPFPVELGEAHTLYSSPPPGSGIILGFMMKLIEKFNLTSESISEANKITTYQRIVEVLKFGYAKRSQLGDMDFSDQMTLINEMLSDEMALETFEKLRDNVTSQDPTYYGSSHPGVNDHGTSHISIVSPNGDAVSVTSTVNIYFGANIMSNSTGIVLNDEMDDFSAPDVINTFNLPPFEDNYIEPGKRPASSMCPTIIVDEKGDVVLTVGAAGGARILSATFWAAVHNLWLGHNIVDAIDAKRLHHQLYPMELSYEIGFDKEVLETLKEIGHMLEPVEDARVSSMSVVTAVSRDSGGLLEAHSDKRKGGGDDGF